MQKFPRQSKMVVTQRERPKKNMGARRRTRREDGVCSPGVGCVEKERSLYAAGCEERAVTGYRIQEKREGEGVKRGMVRRVGQKERQRARGGEEEGKKI